MSVAPDFEWYVAWPDGQGGCVHAVVPAPDEYEAYLRARQKLLRQHPQLEALMQAQPEIRKVAQA